ncbi:hypothetical protein Leryth_018275 [Lithospermum erythrorhizon]|nr:hypothetical protein Leryth_018275 [Lithospermum erythrorhizon]
MAHEMWNGPPGFRPIKSAPSSPAKPLGLSRSLSESFHVTHKVPVGDTPYVRAKNVQLVDKDPEKAIPLFWAAINAGDRVDSALKDMALVMKQQNRAEEAVEAIKSLRHRCSDQAQEALDNILLDLYKRCGRLDDQIALLKHKLFLIHQGVAFNGKRTKTARSQGKKFQVSVEQEATRLLGNLGWALMQQNNYIEAEDAYRRALLIAPDNNKMCNLGICLMKQGRLGEAKETLRRVKPAVADGPRGVDSHLKAYERAQQMLNDLESELMNKEGDKSDHSKRFNVLFGSSAIWQPQPCKEKSSTMPTTKSLKPPRDEFADENANTNIVKIANQLFPPPLQKVVKPNAPFNIDAPPFVSSRFTNDLFGSQFSECSLKRTRSANGGSHQTNGIETRELIKTPSIEPENKIRRQSISPKQLLPDNKDFEDAILAAVLGPETKHDDQSRKVVVGKIDKRLKVFQDITLSLSPRA